MNDNATNNVIGNVQDYCARERCLLKTATSLQVLHSTLEEHCNLHDLHWRYTGDLSKSMFDQLMHCYIILSEFPKYEEEFTEAHDCYCNVLENGFEKISTTYSGLLESKRLTLTNTVDTCEVENLEPEFDLIRVVRHEAISGTHCFNGIGDCMAKFDV